MSELTEKINAEFDKFGDMGEYGVCDGLKVARDVIEEHELQHKIELNENQQIVLNWLKDKYTITDIEPIELFWRLHVNTKNRFRTLLAYRAYKSLTRKAQLEVLQVFSQWALEQEGE